MHAKISGRRDDRVGVHVDDDEGRQHGVVVLATGEIDEHVVPDGVPADPEGRTTEQNQLVEGVQRRARYEAHWQTDFDLVEPSWDPNVIRAGISVIESLPENEFARYFQETYETLQDPPVDVPPEDVDLIAQAIYLTEDRSDIEQVSEVLIAAKQNGEYDWVNLSADIGKEADLSIELPPMDFDFPFGERFRDFIVFHQKCQIRDIYHAIGEEPPNDCKLNGIGKMPLYDDIVERGESE